MYVHVYVCVAVHNLYIYIDSWSIDEYLVLLASVVLDYHIGLTKCSTRSPQPLAVNEDPTYCPNNSKQVYDPAAELMTYGV